MKWQLIPRNPAEAVTPPKVEEKEMAVWDPEQAQRFLSAMRGDRYYAAYLLAINGGLRRGEILGLRWQDIDWDRRQVALNQQVVKGRRGNSRRVQGELKTRRSRRTVTISAEMVEALRERQIEAVKEKDLYESLYGPESYSKGNLVFPNEAGEPMNPDAFTRRFKRVVVRLELPPLRLHDTRHTSATLMVAAGVHPRVMADRLGDRVETVLSMYAHSLPGLQGEVAEDIDELLGVSRSAGLPKDCHSKIH